MIDFFFLIPIALGMGLAGLAAFMWTLRSGQYDDLEGAAQRILFEGNEGPVIETRPAAEAVGELGRGQIAECTSPREGQGAEPGYSAARRCGLSV
jgi:cbb3-type cytochrome oxidase maturation protein